MPSFLLHSRFTRPARGFPLRHALQAACLPISLCLPLPCINLVLDRLIKAISKDEPDIFSRLEGHHGKWFRIDPVNLPFALWLRPDPDRPELKACRKRRMFTPVSATGAAFPPGKADAEITGSFLTLLGMIDGRYDGDALFFTRDLHIAGDTEAVVCLRNALDDLDESLADTAAAFFGAPGRKILNMARKASDHA